VQGVATTTAPVSSPTKQGRSFVVYAKPTRAQFVDHNDDRKRGDFKNPFDPDLLPTPRNANSGKKGARAGDNALFGFKVYSDAKLTRDAANNALKVSVASAVVDHIPLVGIVLGALASAGDMVAITGIQLMLLLHVEAAYGKDPDLQRVWQILPVIGGGFGWRALARELSGFVPVAGIPIKGAIAYAGTIVVGESVTFFLEHGHHMNKAEAAQIFERTKNDAMQFARDTIARFKKD